MSPARKDRPEVGAEDRAAIESEPEFLLAQVAVFRHLDLAEQLREMLLRGAVWTGASAGYAFLVDEERRWLVPAATTLPEEDPGHKPFERLDLVQVQRWLGEGEGLFPGLGPFASAGQTWPGTPPGASLALPVRGLQEDPVGLLLLVGPSAPEAEARERFRRLVERSRPAIANALQVLGIRELVIRDDTALCFNRRHFDEFLVEELARASRFKARLSLIFFDMDNLKEVNSRLGHAMGSRALYEASLRVRGKIRKFDKLFRFGGDEFCIVLPETEWHGALEVAERVRESIAGKPFLVEDTAKGVRMTASFGIASFPLHARTKEDLIQRADRAMQRIKRGTKNSIAIAEIASSDVP